MCWRIWNLARKKKQVEWRRFTEDFSSWAASIAKKQEGIEEYIVTEDEQRSTNFGFSFNVKNASLVPPVKEIRKKMRIQALRCHVIYNWSDTRLHVILVLASRSQALRHLYLRWHAELSNMVFVCESGDSDYEGLLGGVNKTIILKGICPKSMQNPIHQNRNCTVEDVAPLDSPNIIQTSDECGTDDLVSALGKFGIIQQ